MGGGKFHIDVISPGKEVGFHGRVDAHDKATGNMTEPFRLPDGKVVYCTKFGQGCLAALV